MDTNYSTYRHVKGSLHNWAWWWHTYMHIGVLRTET